MSIPSKQTGPLAAINSQWYVLTRFSILMVIGVANRERERERAIKESSPFFPSHIPHPARKGSSGHIPTNGESRGKTPLRSRLPRVTVTGRRRAVFLGGFWGDFSALPPFSAGSNFLSRGTRVSSSSHACWDVSFGIVGCYSSSRDQGSVSVLGQMRVELFGNCG